MVRGPDPAWFSIAESANRGDNQAREWLGLNAIHASEFSWAGTEFDLIIDNNGSVEELYSQLKNLV
jgi:hypothetical protein